MSRKMSSFSTQARLGGPLRTFILGQQMLWSSGSDRGGTDLGISLSGLHKATSWVLRGSGEPL